MTALARLGRVGESTNAVATPAQSAIIDALCDGLFYATESGSVAARESASVRYAARQGLVSLHASKAAELVNLVPVPDNGLDVVQLVSSLITDGGTPLVADVVLLRDAARVEAAAKRALSDRKSVV